jgi:hypothetical protein
MAIINSGQWGNFGQTKYGVLSCLNHGILITM